MKLHLPKLLRHAVLACVTAVAGVTTTIGTATFTGGVVAVSLAGHQAWAGWAGNTYYFNGKDEDRTPTAAEKGDNVNIMAGDIVEYVMESFTMKDGQSLTIAANPQNKKDVQKLTINNLVATNANIMIEAAQTLALGQSVLTSDNAFADIQVEGTLDLTAITSPSADLFSKNLSKIHGTGTVRLADSEVTIEQGGTLSFTGDLELQNSNVTLKQNNALALAQSVSLSGGKVTILNSNQKFSNLQLGEDAEITLGNMWYQVNYDPAHAGGVATFTGTTTIESGKTLTISNWAQSEISIDSLAGGGSLYIKTNAAMPASIGISKDFTGVIKLRPAGLTHTFDIAADANMSVDQLDISEQIHDSNLNTIKLTGTGSYTLSEGSTGFTKNEQLAEGWAGTVKVTGANITGTVDMSGLTTADSTLNINGLTVADGGALTLGGAVTLDGTVTLAESITNNGTLAFGGELVLDLTGMGDTGSFTLLTGGNTDLAALGMSEAMLSDATKALGTGWVFGTDGTISYTSAALVPDSDWVWEGEGDDDGGGVWGSSDATNWAPETGSTAGQNVVFTKDGAGEVQINGAVEANSIVVSGGEYTFSSLNNADTDKITATSLTIAGANARVIVKNTNAITDTQLINGELVLSGTGTTGGNVVLGGGLLKYDGSTLDISSQVSLATDYTGPVKIEVADDASTTDVVESVTWTKANKDNANGGVDAILANGIVKTGAGTMNVQWQYGTSTVSGAIDVQEGTLNYSSKVTTGAYLTMAGNVYVAEGASFCLISNSFSTGTAADWVTLSGSITGKGSVTIGDNSRSGRYKLKGDNSDFEGTLYIYGDNTNGVYNTVVFDTAAAVGGEKSKVVIHSRNFFFNTPGTVSAAVEFKGTNNVMDGSGGKTYVFTGDILSDESACWQSKDSVTMTVALQGDITGYAGTLKTGTGSTWVLGGEGIASAGAVQATLTGTGTVKIQYNNATTISGVIEGAVNVQQSGTDVLVLTAENTSTGKLTIDDGKKVQLGTADAAGKWAGTTLAGAGTLEIVNGSLENAMTRPDDATASIAVNAAAGKDISLGGTNAGLLSSVTLGADSELTGVTGTLTVGSAPEQSLSLTLTQDNIGGDAAGRTAKISGADITINDASKVTINLTTDDVIDLLNQHRDASPVVDSYLTLTDGTLECTKEQLQKLGIAGTLINYGIRLDGVSGGSIVASGKVADTYFVTGDDDTTFPHAVTHYNTLGMYNGTVIDPGLSLNIELEGDANPDTKVTLNNLLGGTGSSLVVTNTSNENVVTVELSNQAMTDTVVNDPAKIGSITGNKGTELVKTGDGTLEVNGNLVADELKIAAGTLQLDGSSNNVTTLNVAANSELQLGAASTNNITTLNVAANSKLQLGAASTSTIKTLESTDGGAILLGIGSTLAVDGGVLTDVELKAVGGGKRTKVALKAVPVAPVAADTSPVLEVNGDLSLLGTSRIDGIVLDVAEGKTLELAGNTNDVVTLTGSGTVKGVSGTVLSLDNTVAATATYSPYSGALTGAGKLVVENGGGTFTLQNASTSDWSITNVGKMVVDMTGSDTTPGSFACKALTLEDGSSTVFNVNTDNTGGIQLDSLTTNGVAAITINSTGENGIVLEDDGSYVLGKIGNLTLAPGQTVKLDGMAFSRVGSTAKLVADAGTGQLKLQVDVSKENKYKSLAETKNGEAGAELMWNASMAEIAASPVLRELDKALSAAAAAGESKDELLASIAGASTAVLGMAVNNDVDRQLRAIRNRTTTMGVDQGVVNPEMPYYNAWINAEGGNNELRHSGTQGGYKLNSWGGTVGFDVDFSPTFTAGMALTAMYGDLSVKGADQAKGDLDTYYVSAFARYCASAWTHTFVATAGLADMSLSRTVAGEEVEGDTNGMSFGLMYEAGRVFALNEDATACLQPILNVAWRHTTVDGYTEKGSDLGLKVDEQTYDSLTVGLGARLQAVVGESLYNRTSIFECRALVKAELGDHQGTSEVTLAGASAEVESAEMGSVGLEAGAGITIPLGDEGSSIFADASIEVYSGYTNVNGTVGYRINF